MNQFQQSIIITGVGGFIGSEVAKALSKTESLVIGIDNMNSYYEVNLKKRRLENIIKEFELNNSEFHFFEISIEDQNNLNDIFQKYKPNIVINLAAQAGVRYSIKNPQTYFNSNLIGFGNILENCRNHNVSHLVYASSSSVYGSNEKSPFKESHGVDHPVSLYAATKKANELLAHSYSHLYKISATGLRFFTVYGPWGRPDMAPMLFTKSILKGEPIKIFNNGNMERDFTYIDDIVEGIIKCCFKPATINCEFDKFNPDPSTSFAPHRIFNIGNCEPVKLLKFIDILEDIIGKRAIKEFLPMQNGDVIATCADTSKLKDWVGFSPRTSLREGLKRFVGWYKDYYG